MAQSRSIKHQFFPILLVIFAALQTIVFTPWALATEAPEQVPTQAQIIEHLGQPVDTTLSFVDENQQPVTLNDLLADDRPVVIAPVYFRCPRLCDLTQSALAKVINELELELGKDYRVVSLSFNPEESSEQAMVNAEKYQALVGNAGDASQWRFLTGEKANIEKTLKQLGFAVEPDGGEFVHSAALIVLMPGGNISRYFYGINYDPDQLRFALVEAAQGKIGNTLDRLYMYCFRFDPSKGKYSLAVWNLTRLFCTVFFVVVAVSLLVLRLRE